ncbi:STAS domain-containing protein [Streptomyces gibsoniae]|uniref:Anti-sigma factor antagonist n=1 Tax=Streptomyces gibsoniae TaxID=3075529 RepID=A0ABU2TTH0_9ACTN|nr:STAS domain-containing protein [Streptomyces sp. DSM 41699]MDT0464185.1 STAS domain-containing protein [Streptomyces sp. DSM 41699]
MSSEPVAANPFARSYTLGPYTVVEVSGEIDMATAGSVAEHLEAATGRPAPDVLVDLRPVVFFDCSGLRALCRAESRARERGGRLRLVSDRPRVHRLLRAAGLLRRFPPLATMPGPQPGSPEGTGGDGARPSPGGDPHGAA